MKNPYYWLAAGLLSLPCGAAQIARESFDYPSGSSLITQAGGSGWIEPWYVDAESAVTGAAGLGYTDLLGNVLDASGLSADTTGTLTTRSLRQFSGTPLNNIWISFLYQLPATNAKFEGVTFFRGTQQVFSVSNPSTANTAAIFLTNNLFANAGINTGTGIFGQTHLVVLKLTKGGGTGGTDRVEAFIDPFLNGNPSAPTATVDGANFDIDSVRIAGQDGSTLLVDEFRIGDTFTDVTPHVAGADPDSDGDGLTDGQEAVLGLDPNISDAGLIAGIQAHADWFDLLTASGIKALGNGGVILQRNSDDPVNLIFEVQQTENLTQWSPLETFNRQVELPSGKNFLRVTLQDR